MLSFSIAKAPNAGSSLRGVSVVGYSDSVGLETATNGMGRRRRFRGCDGLSFGEWFWQEFMVSREDPRLLHWSRDSTGHASNCDERQQKE